MTFLEKIQVIERVDGLIRRKATGTPTELATKLNVSERCVYDIINVMKSMNAPIYYCNIKGSYCYENEVDLVIGFIDVNKNISGGMQNIFLTADFLQ